MAAFLGPLERKPCLLTCPAPLAVPAATRARGNRTGRFNPRNRRQEYLP